MNTYLIKGGKCLSGEIKVSGSKNAILPILAASCISKSIIKLNNVSNLEDTQAMIRILKHLNVNVIYDGKSKMIIDSRNIKNKILNIEEIKILRASYYFMGALLSLYNKVMISSPGGCDFASRPIDLHLYAFSCLGIKSEFKNDMYYFKKTNNKIEKIEFEKVTVGGTINAILASVKIKGVVVIKKGAKEPEVDDLIDFLNKCGSNITRIKDDIVIFGVNELHGCNHYVIDDRIEAQTYLILGALMGRNLKIEYKNKEHIKSFVDLFNNLKIDIKEYDKGYMVNKKENIERMNLTFDVYPALPTDIQPILAIMFTKSKGESVFKDNVYPSRHSQIKELSSMGFNMKASNNNLIIRKNNGYLKSSVFCKDLRGGMSLIIGALLSNKETIIKDINYVKRGYENLEFKLNKVGAYVKEI